MGPTNTTNCCSFVTFNESLISSPTLLQQGNEQIEVYMGFLQSHLAVQLKHNWPNFAPPPPRLNSMNLYRKIGRQSQKKEYAALHQQNVSVLSPSCSSQLVISMCPWPCFILIYWHLYVCDPFYLGGTFLPAVASKFPRTEMCFVELKALCCSMLPCH